ncbi:MAG: carbamoyltransferase HypF [Pseudomonadota bacterium]|nr:carbamoyltransferase HypF [Pseudomonadota bacterium]
MTMPLIQKTIRVRGVVQGVGFRPTVWRLATELGLVGHIVNDDEGVLIRCRGSERAVQELLARLRRQPPRQARISQIEDWPSDDPLPETGFEIGASQLRNAASHTALTTGVAADLAPCEDCLRELFTPGNRRYRYPFINCTHCGPRLSIVSAIPYDRANTSMAGFELCALCRAEYQNPADRRFHAQPNACPRCGPALWLVDGAGNPLSNSDVITQVQQALRDGKIVALKGVGGFQLVVDATNAAAVARLRERKHRPHKPLALMARDMDVVRRYCRVSPREQACLQSAAAPVVLLNRHRQPAANIAPQQSSLGMMLPSSPLHHLLLEAFDTPLVMTSGNPSGEPQCIDNDAALARLGAVADLFLLHNRDIRNRVDDSVVRVIDGQVQPIRRGRGFAPAPMALPPGFENCPPVLALGAELKNTFCLLDRHSAVLSQHIGDLQDASTLADFERSLTLYQQLYQHRARYLAVDAHPQYHSGRVGRLVASERQLPVIEVQHHHAHLAACLGDNHWPLEGGRVLAITLDGLGYAPGDEALWGGEILLGDYHSATRVARLKPVPLPGGDAAMMQPWRNAVAHLHSARGWDSVLRDYGALPPLQAMARQPVATLLAMITKSLNAPLSSSCGRLFDAVAALAGLCDYDAMSYEGQAAMALEAAIDDTHWRQARPYPFALQQVTTGDGAGLWELDPAPMWEAMLTDLIQGQAVGLIAARFHQGLAAALVDCVDRLQRSHSVTHVALSGGVFQNRHLQARVCDLLPAINLQVLTHRQVPANDGGIALGQALVAAATHVAGGGRQIKRNESCV